MLQRVFTEPPKGESSSALLLVREVSDSFSLRCKAVVDSLIAWIWVDECERCRTDLATLHVRQVTL